MDTAEASEERPDSVEKTPEEETADAGLVFPLAAGSPPRAMVGDAARLQPADPSAIAVDAAAAPSVQNDGLALPRAAPSRLEPVPPSSMVAAVSQHADPLISTAAPVANLEILQGIPGAASPDPQVAAAANDRATNMPGAAAIAGQAQQAAAAGASSPTSEPAAGLSGADAGASMAIAAAGGASEAGDGARDTGDDAGDDAANGEGDHSGAAAAGLAYASAAGRGEAARGEATTTHSLATQVAAPVARAAKNGMQRVEIALEPAALGRVDVRLDFSPDGRVNALFVADNRQALEALKADAQTLARALSDAGVDTGSLNFGLRQGEQGNDGGRFQPTPGRASAEKPAAGPEPPAAVAAVSGQHSSSRDRLDIRA